MDIAATFTPQPSVGSVGPSSGPRTGGTSVTIHGSGLTGATAVKFGSVPATGVVSRNECRLGKVKGDRSGKVKSQKPKPGGVLASDGKVNFKLG